MNKNCHQRLLAGLGFAALAAFVPAAWAQVAPNLGSLSVRGIAASTFTNGGGTSITNGGLCFTTGTGLATVTVTGGTTDTPCPPAAVTDQNSALATIMTGQPSCTVLPVGIPLEQVSIGGGPQGQFTPGCYTSVGALNISAGGIVTLTGNGVFVFRSTGGAINTGATSIVQVQGGACAGNVFFGAIGLTTLGAASTFVGNIVDAAGVTVGGGTSVLGRLLSPSGTITTDANGITVPAACAAIPPGPVPVPGAPNPTPTMSEWAMIFMALLMAMVAFVTLRKKGLAGK